MRRTAVILVGVLMAACCAVGKAAGQVLQVRQVGPQGSGPRESDLVVAGGNGSPIKPNVGIQHIHMDILLDANGDGPGSGENFGDEEETAGAANVERCPADLDHDRSVTISDLLTFLDLFDASSPRADISRDSAVDLADLFLFLEAFDRGC